MDISTINKGMSYALAAILALSAGIYLIYKKEGTVAAMATAATGVGMFMLSNSMIQQNPPATEIPVAIF